jgi:DNA-binding NtrC family response regulator
MGGSRVLVVDDEPHVLSVVKAMLELGGHDVVTAGDAHRALEIIEKPLGQIALVLSGVHIRGMSGPNLLREIVERTPATAVALMTGGTLHEELLGVKIPVLQKPIPLPILMETVQELLDRQNALAIQMPARIQRSAELIAELQEIGKVPAEPEEL